MGTLKIERQAAFVGRLGLFTALCLTLAPLSGCRVDSNKNGSSENVKIATPFGGMSVKTDDNAVQAGTGLAVYPGATLAKKLHHEGSDSDHDSGAADINMSFGSFHLGVKAVSYETPDPPEKVIDFYKKDMTRFGAVLFCRGGRPVGTPTVTQDGLTCSDDGKNNNHIHVNDDEKGSFGQLKTGSKQHQRIVSVDAEGEGSKFGLVMLDLPGHLNFGDDKQTED